MSKVPHTFYLRKGTGYGHSSVSDALLSDGLTDVYNKMLMGGCVEKTVSEMGISREAQDEFAILSYTRAREAQEKGILAQEIVELTEVDRRGNEKKIS